MTFPSYLQLLLSLGALVGLGNDLLDYLPTEAYWRSRSTEMTFENVAAALRDPDAKELEQLASRFEGARPEARSTYGGRFREWGEPSLPYLQKLAQSEDEDVASSARHFAELIRLAPRVAAVRRLMAIRTLGEMKRVEALPLLQPLLGSKEPFVAEYAAAAVAAIEGRPASWRQPVAGIGGDVWLLPAGCGAVGRVAFTAGPPSIDAELKKLNLLRPGPDEDAQAPVDVLASTVLGLAEITGNLRLDGVTVGVSADIGPDSGFTVALLRGRWDHRRLADAMRDAKVPFQPVEGTDVFRIGEEIAFFLPSDEMGVLVAAPKGKRLGEHAAGMVKTAKAGSSPAGLATNAPMVALVRTADTSRPLWAGAKVGEGYRRLPLLEPFDSLALSATKLKPGEFQLRLDARGSKAGRANEVVAQAKRVLGEIHGSPEGTQAEAARYSKTLRQVAAASTLTADGNGNASALATVRLSPADVLRMTLTAKDAEPADLR